MPRTQSLSDRSARGRVAWRPGAASRALGVGTALVSVVLIGAMWTPAASAATTVQLGTAAPFAVLAYSSVADTPTSAITGNVGLSPTAGTAITGLTQAEVNGTIYTVDGTGPTGNVNNPGLLTTAKNDLNTAFGTAAGESPTNTFNAGDNQLGGQTLVPGVYAFGHASTANITAASPLVLNGQGDPNAVFVFQASSDLVTASGSVVQLVNGAQACNVFWVVNSSATLGSGSSFVGTIMALASATLTTGATVQGRILARTAAVTLDHNTITVPAACTVAASTPTTTPATTATTSPTGGSGAAGHATGSGGTAAGAGGTGTGASTGTSTGTGVVPTGFPHTGAGGAAHSNDTALVALGALALAASGVATAFAIRRRTAVATVVVSNGHE